MKRKGSNASGGGGDVATRALPWEKRAVKNGQKGGEKSIQAREKTARRKIR